MVSFHGQISKSRSDLELQSIEAASTSDAVSFITYVQSLKRNMKVNNFLFKMDKSQSNL